MPTVGGVRAAMIRMTGDAEPSVGTLQRSSPEGHQWDAVRQDMMRAQASAALAWGALRRTRLVAWDESTTTWEAWEGQTGQRHLVRVLRPARAEDASARRWLAGIAPECVASDLPLRLVSPPIEAWLSDVLPLEDPPDRPWVMAILGGIIDGLRAAQTSGAHGLVDADLVVRIDGSWCVPPLARAPESLRRPAALATDLRHVGRIAALLGDEDFSDFELNPPPSAVSAYDVFLMLLGDNLASAHHDLIRRLRSQGDGQRRTALRDAIRRLKGAYPPPRVVGCVRVDRAGVHHLVCSDGVRVTGGPRPDAQPHHLSVIWEDGRLNVSVARALLRAWNARHQGADDPVAATCDPAIDLLMRWLAACCRLRTDQLLLEAAARR